MKIKLSVICALACSVALFAQEPNVSKIVRVRGNPNEIAELVGDRSVSRRPSKSLQAIVLIGKQADVARVEKTIEDLDSLTPPSVSTQNVELFVYVVGGANQPFIAAQEVGGPILSPVVKQLKATFPYAHYQLLSTMIMRSALNGSSESSGLMGIRQNPAFIRPTVYDLGYNSAKLSNDATGLLHLNTFRFHLKVPIATQNLSNISDKAAAPYQSINYQEYDLGIQTDVDLREGQKVVVGKTNIADSDSCIFLVLSAKLVP